MSKVHWGGLVMFRPKMQELLNIVFFFKKNEQNQNKLFFKN
jgi:hypothetical protein